MKLDLLGRVAVAATVAAFVSCLLALYVGIAGLDALAQGLPVSPPGGLTVTIDGQVVGTFNSLAFTSGNGIVWSSTPAGSTLNVAAGINTAREFSREKFQSGACDFIDAHGSGVVIVYSFGNTCSAITQYVRGMRFRLVMDTANVAGGFTVNLDSVGAVSVKDVTGLADPPANFVKPGQQYEIWFDGKVFRLG